MRLFSAVFGTLLAILIMNLFAAGVQCYGGAVEAAARAGQSIEHPRSYTCPGGCRCQCVAAVFELCNLPETRLWRKGDHVNSFYVILSRFINAMYRETLLATHGSVLQTLEQLSKPASSVHMSFFELLHLFPTVVLFQALGDIN